MLDLDATGQAALVLGGEVSPRELVEAAIARIEERNPAINAVVTPLFERALAAASDGLPDGPFRGVPLVLKDVGAPAAGEPYALATRVLRRSGFSPRRDSHVASLLRAAGFVNLGRTNAPELGLQPTTEPLSWGPARNPWDRARTPLGSSGGSAAAVASGMVAVGHGNDGGGSIRLPASACGLVGLKPSRGRISWGPGLSAAAAGLGTEGVLTRSVRDTAALLDVLAVPCPGDPVVAPPPARPFAQEVGADPGRLRVGVLERAPDGCTPVHPDCLAAVRRAATLLAGLGHEVDDDHPSALDDGRAIEEFRRAWCVNAAQALVGVRLIAGHELGPADVEPLTLAMADEGAGIGAVEWLMLTEALGARSRALARWWEAGHDLLLTPTAATPPPPLGTLSNGEPGAAAFQRQLAIIPFTPLFNASGQPAVSLPLGESDGVPVGAQLVAAYGREDVLIRVAAQLEEASPWTGLAPVA